MLHDQVTSPNIFSLNFQEAIISCLLRIRYFILHILAWKFVLGNNSIRDQLTQSNHPKRSNH